MLLRSTWIGWSLAIGLLGCDADRSSPRPFHSSDDAHASRSLALAIPSTPRGLDRPARLAPGSLKLGQEAMLYDLSEEYAVVSVWDHTPQGKAVADRIRVAVGTPVRFLGRVTPGVGENDPEPNEQVGRARVLVLWGKYRGRVGFADLASLRALPRE